MKRDFVPVCACLCDTVSVGVTENKINLFPQEISELLLYLTDSTNSIWLKKIYLWGIQKKFV